MAIHLKSTHIIIEQALAASVFGTETHAFVAYVPEQEALLITPVTSQWFAKMHEPKQYLLKEKNLKGDKSLSVRDIFIDFELEAEDKMLSYELVEKTNLLKVKLNKSEI